MIPQNNNIRFEVTTACNYSCPICPLKDLNKFTRGVEIMSFELFKTLLDKILAETNQYKSVTFAGLGEPLLDKTLNEKIAYAKEKHLEVFILTNGSKLTAEKFKELESLGVSSVRVSVHGHDTKSYVKTTGVDDNHLYDYVLQNLNEIVKIKKSTKLILTCVVLEGSNEHLIDDWITYWKDKADLIEVWNPHNWADGKNFRERQSKKLPTCGRPFDGPLQIQMNGTVNMCCFDFNGKLTLGDLKTNTLEEIFTAPLFTKLLQCHKSGDFDGSNFICKDCDQRNCDKTEVLVYSSKTDEKESRVNMFSDTYGSILV